MRVGVLECPAARADVGPPRDPVAADIEHLLGHKPIEAAFDLRDRVLAADFQQSMTGEPGIPDRRDARLAIGLVLMHHQKLLDRLAGDGAVRMIFRIAEHGEHHHAIRHRRENRAEPILAVEVLDRPGDGAVDGALARRFRKKSARSKRSTLSTPRKNQNHDAFCCGAFGVGPMLCGGATKNSSMRTPLALRARGFFTISTEQRNDDGSAPIGDLVEWKGNHFGSSITSTGITGTARHGNEPEQRQHDAGEHVGALGAAAGEHRLARTPHMIRVDRIADHLQREISLHRRADVERAVAEQRPAAVVALDAAQIDRDLSFQLGIDRLAEIVPQQHIFGRNSGVGLELEHPVAVRTLLRQQRLRRLFECAVRAHRRGRRAASVNFAAGVRSSSVSLIMIGSRWCRRRGCRIGSHLQW